MTHTQLLAMKTGDTVKVGPLFKGLDTQSEIVLTVTEKVDGTKVLFDATCFGVKVGEVQYLNMKWEWAA